MLFRNDEMLLRIAQGDAYALPFEHEKDWEFVQQHNTLCYFASHQRHDVAHATYSDDAQMSIGVAEVLSSGKPITSRAFAEAFVRAFKRDPRPGYAGGFQKFLESISDADEFLAKIRPTSEKNGAAMRGVPLGAIKDVSAMLRISAMQAALTHDTDIGVFSSNAVALMSHFALYEKDGFDRLGEYCLAHTHDVFSRSEYFRYMKTPWSGPVLNPATNTIHAVFTLLTTCHTLRDVLLGAVRFMGDTDSVASIAAGIASARMHDPLPAFLEDDLEKGGAYGPAFLRDLGTKLMDRYA